MDGQITKVFSEKKFFFVDNDYFCHFEKYNEEPEIGDIVQYDRSERNGRKNANNVKLIKKASNPLNEYFDFLGQGYFYTEDGNKYIKREFVIDYPQKLAAILSSGDKNKSNQISKFYYNIKHIETIFKIKKDFHRTKNDLLKLSPLATKARERNHISKEFEQFLIRNIELSSQNEENFIEGFLPHFQSLVCYY